MQVSVKWKKRILLVVAATISAAAFFFPPLAQDLSYHDFADKRPVPPVPNAGDVLSNIPFCIVGIWGVLMMRKYRGGDAMASALWHIFFFGVFLVGFGSGYYHWMPNNQTLVWDRLPMTIAFMSLFALVIAEHVSRRAGYALFPFLLVAGIGSVWYWDYTESIGAGDLRPYALVQFLPMVLILMILSMFPSGAGGTRYLIWCLGWYIAAKGLEHYDDHVFGWLGGHVSGHSLKHLAAAAGVACLLPYAKLRLDKTPVDV